MTYVQNDIVRFVLTWESTGFVGKVKNILNFRVLTGEMPPENAHMLVTAMADQWTQRMRNNLTTATYLRHVRVFNQSRPTAPAEERLYANDELTGTMTPDVDAVPQASACIVRHTYSRGRKSIGRYFHGPCPDAFCFNGTVVPDPNLDGDLNDVCDALGDPLLATGITLRPIVCGQDDTISNPGMDVRRHVVSPLVSYMKSRRVGKGE